MVPVVSVTVVLLRVVTAVRVPSAVLVSAMFLTFNCRAPLITPLTGL